MLSSDLRVHGADGGKAGRREQVEHQVGQSGRLGCMAEDAGHLIGAVRLQHQFIQHRSRLVMPHEADGQGAHHVLLGDKAGDSGGGQLPR